MLLRASVYGKSGQRERYGARPDKSAAKQTWL